MTDRPRLILHIGSQKTGTTTLQGFLKTQTEPLAEAGLHYVQAGRTNIAHNSVIPSIRKGHGEAVGEDILAELSQNRDKTCFISSEMFFRPDIARFFAKHLPAALRIKSKVIVYLRRQDKYAEAMYKQRVKNGRYQGTPEEYAAGLTHLDYGQILSHFGATFGSRNLIVRPFERALFPGGDVLQDFAQHSGIPADLAANYSYPSANGTLSKEVSEQLGALKRRNPEINTREVIRHILRNRPEGAIRTSDCLDLETRRRIMQANASRNEELRATYCPELPALFDLSDLSADDAYPIPDKEDVSLRSQLATAAIEAAVADLET
ncbi:hypothetical protein Q4544_10430 [Cognatishimia sp. 1_MG-2023]|uniref:hypothetical protein n=1 Tax=Cognatishimia sp. 1_MG-2023 TaxID=3062642 RepID=UPI0026E46ED5|nr:hypothetical protein [Cognatishimia sp. 1_MG-2023]MDO6727350.1 hypothetical protein [Cognatishimia sp. 1_MG-2023]